MSELENATLMVAVLSMIAAIVSAVFSAVMVFVARSANATARNVNKIENALVELEIHNALTSAKDRELDIALMRAASATEEHRSDVLDMAVRMSHENTLNAYEVACFKYVDGKVDRDRFRRTYFVEIANIWKHESEQNPQFGELYTGISAVHSEWMSLQTRRK